MEFALKLLGERIKFLRKEQQLSQKELCTGICSQPYLSDIEKGYTSPSAFVLQHIASRLGVSITYLLNEDVEEDYINNTIELIRKEVTKRDYKKVDELLKLEKNIFMKKDSLSQFYYWHKGMCQFYLHGNIDGSLAMYDKALKLKVVPYYNFSKLEIMISKANIYKDANLHVKAIELYNYIENYLKRIPEKLEPKMYIRLLYNHTRALRQVGQFTESLEKCMKGIRFCLDFDLMYGLGDLFFQQGLIYKHLKILSLSKIAFEKAGLVYNLNERIDLLKMVDKEISNL
ncbi:helix-turn-helix domain-containing protein [Peribacillus sp. SCS-26]|uniref:helix-turn-helix domain-containing protein n=1 Tax=Paraperibacillus marinus TaxID=3115295 RepID=UPI00390599FE